MKYQYLFSNKEPYSLKDLMKYKNFFKLENRKQRFMVWLYKKVLGLNDTSNSVCIKGE